MTAARLRRRHYTLSRATHNTRDTAHHNAPARQSHDATTNGAAVCANERAASSALSAQKYVDVSSQSCVPMRPIVRTLRSRSTRSHTNTTRTWLVRSSRRAVTQSSTLTQHQATPCLITRSLRIAQGSHLRVGVDDAHEPRVAKRTRVLCRRATVAVLNLRTPAVMIVRTPSTHAPTRWRHVAAAPSRTLHCLCVPSCAAASASVVSTSTVNTCAPTRSPAHHCCARQPVHPRITTR
jgi:hypothetical protein